jgi:mRNA-degrading endonuclease RelE of RelBE toxin-antitoxin system
MGGTGSEAAPVPAGPVLTKSAAAQLDQLSPDERSALDLVLEALQTVEDVQRYGWPVSESPAGEVWRVRAGRVGLFIAVDEDSLLVVGLAVRRPGSGEFYSDWD